jgi:tryptophanyl-tRNA synthetase
MAQPEAATELPIREEKKAAAEQEINPWDVQAGTDENGNSLAFDYVAISKYVGRLDVYTFSVVESVD